MNYEIDDKLFQYYNGRVKQIFLYLTDECQLRCRQCLYKPNLTFQMKRKDIPFQNVINLMEDFHELGAQKVTFMGGEPFLYLGDYHYLLDLIKEAKRIGYTYIRADTNGQNDVKCYSDELLRELNDLSFSIDGFTEEINDSLRGAGSFNKCVAAIKTAVDNKCNVELTTCVHPAMLLKYGDEYGIEKMIRFGDSLGAKAINFHVLFKHGFPMDTWTGEDTANEPIEWIRVRDRIQSDKYKIKVRIPTQFITKEEFDSRPNYYAYCPVKLGERALIHPDGQIRVCSGLIASKYCIGHYNDYSMYWENSVLNESLDHKLNDATPCTNQSKCKEYGDFVPVCFSFKPYQKEYVWANQLKWDNKQNE